MLNNYWVRKSVMLLLILVTLVSVSFSVGASTYIYNLEWEDNVLIEKPLDVMTRKKDKIVSVTFLDTLDDAPQNPWHLGPRGAKDSVQGWIEWKSGKGYAYIAAEGGINGKDACDELFMECESLQEIHFNGAFHTDKAESMVNMFYMCYDLEEVDLENLNTSNVESMYQMFRNCSSLEKVNLSKMDTSRVETMYCMFSTCSSLEELDLRSFDTSNVTNMAYMFSACSALESVDVSSFDTSKVTTMAGMFRWCSKLKVYNFDNWDVSQVENYSGFMNSGMKINGKKWENFFK